MKNLKKLFIKAAEESSKICKAEDLRSIVILEWYGNEALFSIEYADQESKEYKREELRVELENNED